MWTRRTALLALALLPAITARAEPSDGGVLLELPRTFKLSTGGSEGPEEGARPPEPGLRCEAIFEAKPPSNAPPAPEYPNELDVEVRGQKIHVRCNRALELLEKQRLALRLKQAFTLRRAIGPLTAENTQPIVDETVRKLGREAHMSTRESRAKKRAFGGAHYGVRGVAK